MKEIEKLEKLGVLEEAKEECLRDSSDHHLQWLIDNNSEIKAWFLFFHTKKGFDYWNNIHRQCTS